MALKFGTSGVRGLVTELTDKEVSLFTTAFLKYAKSLGQNTNVAVGYDLRNSSPKIMNAAISAIQKFGYSAHVCGKIATPGLAYYAQQKQLLAIMITGSHIPNDRNGIKFYLLTGETLKKDEQAIFEIYEKLKSTFDETAFPANNSQIISCESEASQLYTQRYLDFFSKNALAGLKLLFYQHSSIARDLFPDILEKLGAQVIRIGRSETFVPVDTEAVDSVDMFKSWILEHNADALISTDGDADRPLFVDKNGQVLPGDKIGALASLFLKIDTIAYPISCNSGIAEIGKFANLTTTKIGSPFVIEALNELSKTHQHVAGFEANGGYLLQTKVSENGRSLQKLPTRDAVLPVLCILAMAQAKKVKTTALAAMVSERSTSSGLLKSFATERSLAIIEDANRNPDNFFKELLPGRKLILKSVNKLDGFRCSFAGGEVIHLRPSGNAPEFRCYTEASVQKLADDLCVETLAALKTK